jgi:hypothetical protein
MIINFPFSPKIDQVYIQGNLSWQWNGIQWVDYIQSEENFNVANTVSTDSLTANSITVSGNVTAANFIGNFSTANINSSSNILYVAKNGNDSNDGSLTRPFLTIKAALAAASAGNISVHVAPGTYYENNPMTIPANVALMGDNLRNISVIPLTPAADLFYMTNGCYVWGITIRGYTANGFSYDPNTPNQNVFVSPYIQNLTSSTTTGTAVYIDGSKVSQFSTKAMIVGFFTIINLGGKGIHLVNSAYSQLVNIYTIGCDIGIYAESGSFCTLNGSDCSIGNYGLKAEGYGPLQTSGALVSQLNGELIIGSFTGNVKPQVNTLISVVGDPNYYTIDTINTTSYDGSTLLPATQSRVVVQQYYTQSPSASTVVNFYVRSAIIASAHTFEYVGAGTVPSTALPQYGGQPIEANEVVTDGLGIVTFTSTDHKGNFKVGSGLTFNQATGTISGQDFYRSLFAQMTPFILALGN